MSTKAIESIFLLSLFSHARVNLSYRSLCADHLGCMCVHVDLSCIRRFLLSYTLSVDGVRSKRICFYIFKELSSLVILQTKERKTPKKQADRALNDNRKEEQTAVCLFFYLDSLSIVIYL